jgi:MFS transporter, NHS family, xanthosine permease
LPIKQRLILMNFLQFFVWGSWLITLAVYCINTMHWSFQQFGPVFSTIGISSLFMPALAGMIADRWISAEKLYGTLHFLGGITLLTLPFIKEPSTMFWVMLINMIFYMPTISLSITIAYSSLKEKGENLTKTFPPIRVWGTIGFVAALWTIDLCGFKTTSSQFYVASFTSFLLGFYSFTLPKCPPQGKVIEKSFINVLGLNALMIFKQRKMAIFFVFAMLLGASLQLTNAYGDSFLDDFKSMDQFKGLFVMQHTTIIMSISQISETIFILFIPYFLRKFGIKKVMLISMIAWVLRFGLLAYGDPGSGLWMIVLSCIIYGMAFDFFNVSGSLFVETQADPKIRASVQGLFMMMVNGVGAMIGSIGSGILIDTYFVSSDGVKDWHGIWLIFALYSLVVAIAFAFLFRHKHDPSTDLVH